jgi:hypothetical protein
MNKKVCEKIGHIILDVLELSDIEIQDAIKVLADTTSVLCMSYDETDEAGNIPATELFINRFNENVKHFKSK